MSTREMAGHVSYHQRKSKAKVNLSIICPITEFIDPRKSTPLRVVFDPACQFHGVSLNSFLYKGPCLIGNLLRVLLRFREDLVGIFGDTSKMYLQIVLPEEDMLVHRYLWRDLDEYRDPAVYAL